LGAIAGRPTIGAWISAGGRAVPCVGAALGFGAAPIDAGVAVCAGFGGAATIAGGRILTPACCRTWGETAIAAGATFAAAVKTAAGTTVAALRLAKRWLMTCSGGSPVGCRPTIVVISLILVTLTLVILTLRM
jgi:hypothetical protein